MKTKQNTIIFAATMVALIFCFFEAGYLDHLPTLGSIGIGVFVVFSIFIYWLLNIKKAKTNLKIR
jgi:hypothetical protein